MGGSRPEAAIKKKIGRKGKKRSLRTAEDAPGRRADSYDTARGKGAVKEKSATKRSSVALLQRKKRGGASSAQGDGHHGRPTVFQ